MRLACAAVLLCSALTASAQDARSDPPAVKVEEAKVEAPKPSSVKQQKRRRHRRRNVGVPPVQPGPPQSADEPPPAPPVSTEEVAPDAQPEPVEAGVSAAPKKVVFTFHGFAMARATIVKQDAHAAFYGIIPSLAGPRAYLEADLQPTLTVLENRLRVAVDLTLYVSSISPKYLALFNEMFVESRVAGPLYLLAGRKRVVWGSGLAVNPTDLINPVKNPLDFEQQRAGAFLLPLVEIITKKVTLSALVNPRTTYDEYALPTKLEFKKPVVASRAYFLVLGTDVNLMYLYDHTVRHHYGGLSLSRYFGEKFEAHLETLVGQGPSTFPPVPIIPTCTTLSPASSKVVGSLIAGGRLDLADQTFLSLEYFFNGNGFDKKAYDAYRDAAGCTRTALASMPAPPIEQAGHPVDPLFALLRQHYLAVSFVRPHLTAEKLEKISISSTLLWSVEDLSLLLQLRVAYRLYEAVTIGAMGSVFTGPAHGEYASAPTRASAAFDLRASF